VVTVLQQLLVVVAGDTAVQVLMVLVIRAVPVVDHTRLLSGAPNSLEQVLAAAVVVPRAVKVDDLTGVTVA
jgi:hypothetical protein